MDGNSLERWLSPNQIRDRQREKARERQRKRRKERKKKIEQSRRQDSSEEEFPLDFLQQTDQEQTPGAPAGIRGPNGDRLYRREYNTRQNNSSRRQLVLEDAGAQSAEQELTTSVADEGEENEEPMPLQDADSDHIVPEMGSQDVPEDELEQLARAFAMIKCSSYVSDAAIEKLFAMFTNNAPQIMGLVNSGRISHSYLNTVKPTMIRGIPTVFSALYAHKVDEEGQLQTVHERDLTSLPVEALAQEPPYAKVMWYDSYVLLKDIVDLHITIHVQKGMKPEDVHNTLKEGSLSIDGVVESRKGPRRFIVTSIRFGNCIYLWRVVSPLIGDPDAKMDAEDLCRYFI